MYRQVFPSALADVAVAPSTARVPTAAATALVLSVFTGVSLHVGGLAQQLVGRGRPPSRRLLSRQMLPKAVAMSHDRLWTVSRTVELGTPIDSRLADED